MADGGRMSLLSHLDELRSRLLRCTLAVVAGAVVCWIAYPWILDFLLEPYCRIREDLGDQTVFGSGCELLVTDPLEPFSVRMTVAGYGGVALAMPVLLWQSWRFIAPGLYARERRWAIPFVVSGLLLFSAGCALAYWSIPRALDFLVGIGGPGGHGDSSGRRGAEDAAPPVVEKVEGDHIIIALDRSDEAEAQEQALDRFHPEVRQGLANAADAT